MVSEKQIITEEPSSTIESYQSETFSSEQTNPTESRQGKGKERDPREYLLEETSSSQPDAPPSSKDRSKGKEVERTGPSPSSQNTDNWPEVISITAPREAPGASIENPIEIDGPSRVNKEKKANVTESDSDREIEKNCGI
jgi:hypothetical protein